MKKDSIIDYSVCILLKVLGPIIRKLPIKFTFFLGAKLGELFYYFNPKHKSIAYANIKTVFAERLSPARINNLTRKFYRTFGQNLMEIFLTPAVNQKYINKYIKIEGLNYIKEGFKKGKGVILLGAHEGSWELSGIICANLGIPFNLFVRGQRYPRLNRLLNLYRSQKQARLIQREDQTRQLIRTLKDNQAVGMTIDQGGKDGTLVKFLGRNASMASGALRLAVKYDATIIPSFYLRERGPYIKIILGPLFEIIKTGNTEVDIRNNLQRLVSVFEEYILKYPQEYLWSYKIWKYTDQKSILILSDKKVGHLRQSQALADIIKNYLKDKGINTHIDTVDVEFKSRFARYALIFSSCLAGKYCCQGCLWCLKRFLKDQTYKSLITKKSDIVISCGSSLAAINFIISRDNVAQSLVIMRPSFLSTNRFGLVILPRHDRPSRRKNVLITEGALNLIDEEYLSQHSRRLIEASGFKLGASNFYIGLLIGGNTKRFLLSKDTISGAIKEIKSVSERLDADILVTTSRRSPKEVEELIKEEFKNYDRCKFLVIAGENNPPYAVGGILGLSKIAVVSGESISMISEAASSDRYIIVFKSKVRPRHNQFLQHMQNKKYIYLCEPRQISSIIEKIEKERPVINVLKDRAIIKEALKEII